MERRGKIEKWSSMCTVDRGESGDSTDRVRCEGGLRSTVERFVIPWDQWGGVQQPRVYTNSDSVPKHAIWLRATIEAQEEERSLWSMMPSEAMLVSVVHAAAPGCYDA